MFSSPFRYNSLRFINEKADKTFNNICFTRIGTDDQTPLAVIRALLYKRISADTSVSINSLPDPTCISYTGTNVISFIFPNATDDLEACKRFINSNTLSEDWVENKPIENFLKPYFNCMCWINEQQKLTIFIVLSTRLSHHHLSLAIFPKLMPWLFNSSPLTEEELTMLNALTQTDIEDFERKIECLYDENYIGTLTFDPDLKNLLEKAQRTALENAKKKLNETKYRVQTMEEKLREVYQTMREEEIAYSALELTKDATKNIEPIKAVIQSNKNLETFLIESDSEIKIKLRGYLDIYNVDVFESIVDNKNSWYYIGYRTNYNLDERQMLLKAIFSDDPTFKIAVRGSIRFNLDNLTIKHESVKYANDVYVNPHLEYYNCFGTTYKTRMFQAEKDYNIPELISLANASLHSINVSESATFGRLIKDFFEINSSFEDRKMLKCTENGTMYNVHDAIEYLKNKENEE